MPALRTSILTACADVVTALDLTGLDGGVKVRKGKRSTAAYTFPCVEISRDTRPDEATRLSFHRDSPGYPVRIAFLVNDPLGSDGDVDKVDDWSQAICRAFAEPEAMRSRVPAVWNVTVRPLVEISQEDTAYSRFAGGLVATVFTVEPRGVGA